MNVILARVNSFTGSSAIRVEIAKAQLVDYLRFLGG